MAGQLLLAAADKYITGRPKITYFNPKYEEVDTDLRETFEIPFDNSQVNFGQTVTCTIPKKNDILTDLSLKVTLPQLFTPLVGAYVYPNQLTAILYVQVLVSQIIGNGIIGTVTTTQTHFFSVGASVILSDTVSFNGTYIIISVPTPTSFTILSGTVGTATSGTATSAGITPSPTVGYYSTLNQSLWTVNSVTQSYDFTVKNIINGVATCQTTTTTGLYNGLSLKIYNSHPIFDGNYNPTVTSSSTFTISVPPNISSNIFVAMSFDGNLQYSPDGKFWYSSANSLSGLTWNNIAYGNGIFIASPFIGNIAGYSVDGETWYTTSLPAEINQAICLYGNGTYVMIGMSSISKLIMFYSYDGINWNLNPNNYNFGTTDPFYAPVGIFNYRYNNFVVIGTGTGGPFIYSYDGIAWTRCLTDSSVSTKSFTTVSFGLGVGGLSAHGTGGIIAYSNDGIRWTSYTMIPNIFANSQRIYVAHGYTEYNQYGPIFVSIGYDGGNGAGQSFDGQQWAPATSFPNLPGAVFTGISYIWEIFVAVEQQTGYTVWTQDGLTWNLGTNILNKFLYSVVGGGLNITGKVSQPPLSISYNQNINKFNFSSVYPKIYFSDAISAAFWGFDYRQGPSYSSFSSSQWSLNQGGWISGYVPPIQSAYIDSVGNKLINNSTFLIGGQTICSFDGEYKELLEDFTIPYENQQVLKIMNGKFDTTQAVSNRTYYIKLPLGFSESLPMCALSKHDISIQITFNKLENIIYNYSSTFSFIDTAISTISYKTYILILTTSGNVCAYNTQTDTYTTMTTAPGYLYSMQNIGDTLYVQNVNGYIMSGSISQFISNNFSNFSLSTYAPESFMGAPTGNMVADSVYVYYFQLNYTQTKLYFIRFNTIDGTYSYNLFSNPVSLNKVLFTGSQLIIIPITAGSIYFYNLNTPLNAWNLYNYSSQITQINTGVVFGTSVYFICDGYKVFVYDTLTFKSIINKTSIPSNVFFSNVNVINGLIYGTNKGVLCTLTSDLIFKNIGIAGYITAYSPRYIYVFPSNIKIDMNISNQTLSASILASYKDSKIKPTRASIRIIQPVKSYTMYNLDIKNPVKEIWMTGPVVSGYTYSNIVGPVTLSFANKEYLLTSDIGSPMFLGTLQPFETHAVMPQRTVYQLSFEYKPENIIPNGTINFSRLQNQALTNVYSIWARTYNNLIIQDGLGSLLFNS